jgi:multiple sugar transport system ATP-binding protein
VAAGVAFKTGDISIPLDRYAFDAAGNGSGPCVFGIRPEHVAFGEAANTMPFATDAAVEIVEPMGSDTLVWTKLGGHNFSFRVEAEKTLRNGEPIRIGFDPARASLFDSQSGNRM